MRLLTTFLLFLLVVFVVAAAANNYGLLAVSIANGNLQLPLRKQNLGNFKLETDLDDNDDVDSNGDDYTSDGDVVSDVSADFDSDVMSDVDDVDIDDNLFNKFDTPNRLSRKPLFWNATKHLVSKLKDVKSNVMSKVQKKIRQFQLNHRDDLIDLDEMRKMRAKYGPILNKDRITGTFPAPRTTEDWKPRYNRTRRRPYNDEGGNGHHGGNRSFGSDTAAKINSNLLQQRNSHGFQHQQSSDNQQQQQQQQHRQNHNQQQYRHQGYQQQQQQAYQRPYQQQRYRHHTQQRPTYSFPESFTTAVATDILTTEGSRYKEPATTIRWEKSYRGRSYDAATSIGKDTDKSYSTDTGLPTDDRIKVSTDNIYQTTRSVYTEQQIARAVLDSLLAAEGKIAKSSILSEVSTSPRVKFKTKTGLPKEHNQKRNNSLQLPTFEETDKLQLQSTLAATNTGTILPIKSKQSFQQNQQTSTSFTAFPAADISVQPSEFKKQVVETSSNVVATTKMKITAGQQTSSPSQLTLKQPTSSTFNSYVLKDVKRVFHSPYQERSLNAAIVNPLLKRSPPLNTSKDVPATTSGVRYSEEDSLLQLKKMKSTVKDNREDGHRRTTKIASTSSDVITSSPCTIQVNFTTTTKRGGKIRNRKRSTVVISDAEKNSSSNNVTIIRHELVTPAILVERFSTENTFPSTITSKMPLKFDNDVDIVSNAPDNRTTESDDIGHTASAATVSPISSSFTRISTDTLSIKNTYYFTVNETAVKRHHYYTGTWANSPTDVVAAASGDNAVVDIFKTTPKSPNNSPVWITTAKLPEWGLTIGPDDKRPPGVAPRLFNEAPWDNNPYNWDHRRDNKDHHDKDHHYTKDHHHHHNKDHRNRFVTRKNRAASVYDPPYAVRTHKRYFTATLNPHYNADFSRQFATWRPSAPDYNNNNINDDDDDNNNNNNNWHPDDQITVHGLHYYPSTWYPGYEPFTRFARINTGTYSARYGGSSSKEPPPTKTNSMPSYRRTFPSWGTPLYQGRGGDKSVTKVRSKHAARFADKTHVFFTGTFNPHLRRAVVTNRVSDRPHDNAVVVSSTTTTTGHNFLSRLYNRIVGGGGGAEATKESSTVDIYNYVRPTIKTTRTIIDEAETPDPFNFVGITEKPEITSTVDFNTKGLPEVEEPTTVTIDYNTIGTSRKNKRKHHVPYHQLQAFQQQPTTSSAITGGATWSPFHATYRYTFQLPSTTSTMIGATWSPFHKFDRSIAATHRTTTTTVKVEEKTRDDDVVVTTELSSSPTSTEKYSVGTWSYSDYTPNPTTTAATTEITTGTIIISNKTITTAETSPVVVITAALDDDVKSSTSTAAPTAKSRKTRKPRKSTIASSDGVSKSRKTRKPRKTTITSTLDDSDDATGRITTAESPLSRTSKASSSSSSSSKKKKSTSTVVKLQNSRKKKHHPVYPTAAIDLDFN